MPHNFSFVLDGKLAGSALPGEYQSLAEDLEELKREGIVAVVSLTEKAPGDSTVFEAAGIRHLHVPVPDFAPPALDQIFDVDSFAQSVWNDGSDRGIAIHCRAGIGRTGTILACLLVSMGLPAEEAMARVREERPGSIETLPQEKAVFAWENYLKRKSAKA